jgi:hypothetical protein
MGQGDTQGAGKSNLDGAKRYTLPVERLYAVARQKEWNDHGRRETGAIQLRSQFTARLAELMK